MLFDILFYSHISVSVSLLFPPTLSWNYLLGYNVAVIVVKAFLQMLGCVFLHELGTYTCWLVHLLGIACVKKFGDESDEILAAGEWLADFSCIMIC